MAATDSEPMIRNLGVSHPSSITHVIEKDTKSIFGGHLSSPQRTSTIIIIITTTTTTTQLLLLSYHLKGWTAHQNCLANRLVLDSEREQHRVFLGRNRIQSSIPFCTI
jgi:hypothetical protein